MHKYESAVNVLLQVSPHSRYDAIREVTGEGTRLPTAVAAVRRVRAAQSRMHALVDRNTKAVLVAAPAREDNLDLIRLRHRGSHRFG